MTRTALHPQSHPPSSSTARAPMLAKNPLLAWLAIASWLAAAAFATFLVGR